MGLQVEYVQANHWYKGKTLRAQGHFPGKLLINYYTDLKMSPQLLIDALVLYAWNHFQTVPEIPADLIFAEH